jgi:hypothetical protein
LGGGTEKSMRFELSTIFCVRRFFCIIFLEGLSRRADHDRKLESSNFVLRSSQYYGRCVT